MPEWRRPTGAVRRMREDGDALAGMAAFGRRSVRPGTLPEAARRPPPPGAGLGGLPPAPAASARGPASTRRVLESLPRKSQARRPHPPDLCGARKPWRPCLGSPRPAPAPGSSPRGGWPRPGEPLKPWRACLGSPRPASAPAASARGPAATRRAPQAPEPDPESRVRLPWARFPSGSDAIERPMPGPIAARTPVKLCRDLAPWAFGSWAFGPRSEAGRRLSRRDGAGPRGPFQEVNDFMIIS